MDHITWLRLPVSARDHIEVAIDAYHRNAPMAQQNLKKVCPSWDTIKDHLCDAVNGSGKVGIRYDEEATDWSIEEMDTHIQNENDVVSSSVTDNLDTIAHNTGPSIMHHLEHTTTQDWTQFEKKCAQSCHHHKHRNGHNQWCDHS